MKLWICTAKKHPCSGACTRQDEVHVDDEDLPSAQVEAERHVSSRDLREAVVHVEFVIFVVRRTPELRIATYTVRRLYKATVAPWEAGASCPCGKPNVKVLQGGYLREHRTPEGKACQFSHLILAQLGKRKEDV